MLTTSLDETKDPKPCVMIRGAEVALAKLTDAKVGKKYRLVAEVEVEKVYSTTGDEGDFDTPYVELCFERYELVPEPPTAEELIAKMYPSNAQRTTIYPV